MTKKQYAKMDWEAIESIVYSDNAHPFAVLAPQKSGKDTLMQVFFPFAKEVAVVLEGKEDAPVKMEMVDEEGFFATFIPGTAKKAYCYKVSTADGEEVMIENPYDYAPVIPKDSFADFINGECTDAYRVLGAHVMTLNGKEGVNFAVWAPNALRVSVIGAWNHWDGRVHPMEKLDEFGIFTLFIPGIKSGDAYRFELKVKGNEILLKDDPYAKSVNEDGYALVPGELNFAWTDKDWNKNNSALCITQPMSICRTSLLDLLKTTANGKKKASTIIKEAVTKLVNLGYTNVELTEVTYQSKKNENTHSTLFYYVPETELDEGLLLKEFINECHKAGLGVFFDWSVSYFAKDSNGLEWFDGSCLYEHADPRQGYQPAYDAKVFQYRCLGVKSFLVSNAYYWLSKYHFDGICFNDLASVLYLDYGRSEWVCNAYGGKENLEFIDFIKEFNAKVKNDFKGVLTVANIDAVWADVSVKNNHSLGFDYVWNNGFKNDFVSYLQTDSYARQSKLMPLLHGLDYAYNENFVLPIMADYAENGFVAKLPGNTEEKYATMRAAYAFGMLYPGKKLNISGIDSLVSKRTKKAKDNDYSLGMEALISKMNGLYKSEVLLSGTDDKTDGFAWINHEADVANVITGIRKGNKKNEILYMVANFSDKDYEALNITVPMAGKYKEILSTDDVCYCGTGCCNEKEIATQEKPYDESSNTLTLKSASMSVSIFSYKPFTAKELAEIAEHKRQLRIAYVKSERAKIEKRRDEIIAEAIKDAEERIKELEKILEEK